MTRRLGPAPPHDDAWQPRRRRRRRPRVRPAALPQPPDLAAGTGLSISEPLSGTLLLGDAALARGTVSLGPDDRPPWLMLYAIGECKFYLVAPVMADGGTWSGTLYVDPAQHGAFVAYVVVVDATYDARRHAIAAGSRSPYIVRLPPGARVVHVTVRCCA